MYSMKDIYPNISGVSTIELTIPERAEQASYEQLDKEEVAPEVAPKAGNIWMAIVVLIILMWVFNLL